DVVFVGAYTSAAPLAYALAKRWRRAGTTTVIGGPHAKGFPDDCLRFFDVAVGDCDRALIAEILRDRPRGERLTTGRPLTDVPTIEERLPEIRTASFWRGRPHPYVVVGVLSSVGCPYRCGFCTDWDTDYALLPLDRLAADLRFVATTMPMVKVAFHDPNFGVRFDPVMATIERLTAEAPVTYMIEASLSVLRGARLARLRDTGCWYVATGVESWAEYSNKTAASTHGREKLERVLAHFAAISTHVPVLQANFIFGVDGDRGAEPAELTREFIRRAPAVWPNLTVPTPFGGTPLYDAHRSGGRILETMPFAFYNTPYLVTTPAHYAPADYYDAIVAVLEELTTPAVLRARLAPRRGMLAVIDGLRLLGIRRALGEYRAIAALLRSDVRFRAFHERRATALPAFYAERFARLLGPYAELLAADERVPRLPPPAYAPAAATTPTPAGVEALDAASAR
ncbi:MAG TPA: radical SAM protein, partial [Candidatus Binatia bacterium]|nr:radical SAM protein [Candidatus Binatia bacterium]